MEEKLKKTIIISSAYDKTIVTLVEDMVGSVARKLAQELLALYEKEKHHVVLDLKEVNYVGSSGVGVLMQYHKKFSSKNGGLYICGLKPPIQRLLMEMNLVEHLNIFSSFEELEFELSHEDVSEEGDSLELGLQLREVKQENGRVILMLGGTVDTDSDILILKDTLRSYSQQDCKEVVMDLGELIYMGDSGIAEMCKVNQEMKKQSGKLVLNSVNPAVQEQLDIMGVKQEFQINS